MTLKEYLNQPDIKDLIKEKNISAVYKDLQGSHKRELTPEFTQALYVSGIDPFKYFSDKDKTDWLDYLLLVMFRDAELGTIVEFPEYIKSLPQFMFDGSFITELHLKSKDVVLNDVYTFNNAAFGEIHLPDIVPTLSLKYSKRQTDFDNGEHELKIVVDSIQGLKRELGVKNVSIDEIKKYLIFPVFSEYSGIFTYMRYPRLLNIEIRGQ